LHARIALPLEAPRDWSRDNPISCKCEYCHDLGVFLTAPDQERWRLKAAKEVRRHVEYSISTSSCDLHCATEKRGSPHSLVATKTQASYERRVQQRREDLKHVAALEAGGA
jgi:hypothetical protein